MNSNRKKLNKLMLFKIRLKIKFEITLNNDCRKKQNY